MIDKKFFSESFLKGVCQSGDGDIVTQSKKLTRLERQDICLKILKKRGVDAYQTQFAKMIVHDDSFIEAHIEGKRRIGKSSYGLLVMYEVYQDWDVVFNNWVFSLWGFIEKLQEIRKVGVRRPIIMYDDAGVGASAAVYYLDPTLYVYLKGLMDTIGTLTKCLLMTSPDFNLMKPLRGGDRIQLRVKKGRHKYDRIARAYQIGRSVLDTRWATPLFQDNFDVRVPVYEKYLALREELSFKNLDDIENYKKSFNKKGKFFDLEEKVARGETELTRREYETMQHRAAKMGQKFRMKDYGITYGSKKSKPEDNDE